MYNVALKNTKPCGEDGEIPPRGLLTLEDVTKAPSPPELYAECLNLRRASQTPSTVSHWFPLWENRRRKNRCLIYMTVLVSCDLAEETQFHVRQKHGVLPFARDFSFISL